MAANVATVLQGLECSMCFSLLEEPKLLSCTHSFCEKCLEQLHHSQRTANNLKCPLCSKITQLDSEGVSSLEANVPLKSKVEDMKRSKKLCTLCDPSVISPAVSYCQQCDEYMCEACMLAHEKFRKNASHGLVSVDDITSGTAKVKQMCLKHAGEERLWMCKSCKVSICFRCRMLDHNGSDHEVQEVNVFKNNMDAEIETLKKKGFGKMDEIKSFTKIVEEQSVKVEVIFAEREADINKAFDETLLQQTLKKNDLLDQCRERKAKLKEELCKHGKNGNDLIASVSSACELVGNGVRALLEGEALVVHTNLCKELQDMIDRDNPDESKPEQVTSQAEAVSFTPCKLEDAHNLGMFNINKKDWVLKKIADFATSGKQPGTMAQTKYGKMLAGCRDGGIEEFIVSGPQKTVLRDTKVMNVSVLSDGRYVVRDDNKNISLYTPDWFQLYVREFEMNSVSDLGGMDVDKYNNIYIGYSKNMNTLMKYNKTIKVFPSDGGAPIRDIPCHAYEPNDICTMNHSTLLVVSNLVTVRVIDQQGAVKHEVTNKGFAARPAVLYDDSILIGWRKDGLLNVDLHTNRLAHVRTVIGGLECHDGFPWALREFSSGEIALWTESKFEVFRAS